MPAHLFDIDTELTALRQDTPPGQRLLGFDVGSKTLGLALSDSRLVIATPIETIHRSRFSDDIVRISTLVSEHHIGGFIVGLPLNMNGSEGPRCQSVRAFASNLTAHLPLPLAFWDERLSTAVVTRTLIEADASRKRRQILVDKMAAAYILQGALDRLGQMVP
ncbi:MAG: Holliday junction resolvase RuvX [Parvularculales bacterium]